MSLISNIICTICSEAYTNNDRVYSTSCGHLYHFTCMQKWQSRSNRCPQCRLDAPTTFRIYLQLEAATEGPERSQNPLKQPQQSITDVQTTFKDLIDKFSKYASDFTSGHAWCSSAQEQITQRMENLLARNVYDRAYIYKWKKEIGQQLNDWKNKLYWQTKDCEALVQEVKKSSLLLSAKLASPPVNNNAARFVNKTPEIATHNVSSCSTSASQPAQTHRNYLFAYAKNLRTYGYKAVYCRRGKVFAKETKHDTPIRIYDQDQVDAMIEEFEEECEEEETEYSSEDEYESTDDY